MPLGGILKQLVPIPPDSPHVWVLGTNSSGLSRIYVLDPTTLATVRVLVPPQSGFVFRAIVPSDNFMFVSYSNGTTSEVARYRRDGLSPITGLSGGGPGNVWLGIQAGPVAGGHILFFGGNSSASAFNTATLAPAVGYSTFDGPNVYDAGTSRTFTSFSTFFSGASVYTPYPSGAPTSYNPTVPSPPFVGDTMFGNADNLTNPIAVAKTSAVSVNGFIWWIGRGAGNGVGTTNKPAQENPSTFVTSLLDSPTSPGSAQPNNTSNSVPGGNQIMNAGICYNSSRNTIYVSYPTADFNSFAFGRVDAINPSTSVTTTINSALPFDNTTVLASCDSAGNVLWFTDGVGRVCRIDLTTNLITTTVTLLPFNGNLNPLYTNLSGGLWYSG